MTPQKQPSPVPHTDDPHPHTDDPHAAIDSGAAVSPVVRRRVLAAELRELRRAAGLTHVDVARRLGWQQGKVSKIEGAKQGIGVDAVIALAEVCHAGAEQRDRLVELAHAARGRAWWEGFGDVLASGELTSVGLEAEADSLRVFVAETVPALLRTDAYARIVEGAAGWSNRSGMERRLELMLHRRTRMLATGGAEVEVVLSESAVRRRVGGAEVMGEQLEHLAELGRNGRIELRFLPFDAGAVPASGSFTVLGFQRVAHPDLVVLPDLHDCTCLEDPGAVEAYRTAAGALAEQALLPADSCARLRDMARDYRAEVREAVG
ncbi:helix-turn-helix domain-containing protein [Saccharopolyspora sp. HNM0983]|uniref:Helix-turn-helix domain-containing protein n=1 Tax=Saccharopolyspora montiporae TaxID=2781240 RepID=A0A929BEC6_9PSEU|nr:helix-turn-helix transcriptional regulator [Saccharopolyspora sp. HNM0983]MBE9375942.1 helix-turn-helix domain-containing protein [Saccharopolyspora sp. HNM0983]